MEEIFSLARKISDKGKYIRKETSYDDSYLISDIIKKIQLTDGNETSEADEETYSVESIREVVKEWVDSKISLAARLLESEKKYHELNPPVKAETPIPSSRYRKNKATQLQKVPIPIQIPPDTVLEELWSGDLYDETGEATVPLLKKDLESDLESMKGKKLVLEIVKNLTS
jgi:hypothetical protein